MGRVPLSVNLPDSVLGSGPYTLGEGRPTVVRAVGGARGHRVILRRVGNVTVLTLQGEISEQFDGLEMGRRLRGEVVVDLSQVERITSFGVREWLTMLRELYATRLTFARCSEPFVNQLSMIRSFCGTGRIASFFAPYACTSCGTQFSALYDAVDDQASVRHRNPAPVCCPRCGELGQFDDDPDVYLSLEHHLLTELEPQVALALGQLDELGGAPIRKAVVGQETWITLATRLDSGVRLQRALEGLEGTVVFDLSAVPESSEQGRERFLTRILGLGAEVHQVRLVGCSFELLESVLNAAARLPLDDRIAVVSVRVPVYRENGSLRRVLVDLSVPSNVMALRLGQLPPVVPDWVRETDFVAVLPTLQRALALGVRPLAEPPPVPSLGDRSSLSGGRRRPLTTVVPAWGGSEDPAPVMPLEAFVREDSSSSLSGRRSRSSTPNSSTTLVPAASLPLSPAMMSSNQPMSLPLPAVAVVVVSLVAGVFVGAVGLAGGMLLVSLGAAPDSGASAAAGWVSTEPAWGNEATPSSWVGERIARSANAIELIGRGRGDSLHDALASAETDMFLGLLSEMGSNVVRDGAFELDLPRVSEVPAAVMARATEEYRAHVGAYATPSRVEESVSRRPWGVQVAARYALEPDAWSAAVAHYAETVDFRGISVARTFPTMRGSVPPDAGLIIVATRYWMRAAEPGDVVMTVQGEAVTDLDDFATKVEEAWALTAPGAYLQLQVMRGDRVRQLEFHKRQDRP